MAGGRAIRTAAGKAIRRAGKDLRTNASDVCPPRLLLNCSDGSASTYGIPDSLMPVGATVGSVVGDGTHCWTISACRQCGLTLLTSTPTLYSSCSDCTGGGVPPCTCPPALDGTTFLLNGSVRFDQYGSGGYDPSCSGPITSSTTVTFTNYVVNYNLTCTWVTGFFSVDIANGVPGISWTRTGGGTDCDISYLIFNLDTGGCPTSAQWDCHSSKVLQANAVGVKAIGATPAGSYPQTVNTCWGDGFLGIKMTLTGITLS